MGRVNSLFLGIQISKNYLNTCIDFMEEFHFILLVLKDKYKIWVGIFFSLWSVGVPSPKNKSKYSTNLNKSIPYVIVISRIVL